MPSANASSLNFLDESYRNELHKPMKFGAVVQVACSCVFIVAATVSPTDLRAQTRTLAQAGGWEAFGGTLESGRRTCGIDIGDPATQRRFLLQHLSGNRHLTGRIIRRTWTIPEGTQVPIQLSIDGRAAWTATGSAGGTEVRFTFSGNDLERFERAFRAGSRMRIQFLTGNEADWTFDLTGTNSIMNAFLVYLNAGGPPTQPFSQGQTSPSAAPTQPFAAPGGRLDGPPKQ